MATFLPPRPATAFPILKTEEILTCLNELGLAATKEELQNPEGHSTRSILECLAEICTGLSKEELSQPTFAGLQVVQYPELHDESFPKFNHFAACQKMMAICDIHDFTLKDFITPTPGKLRRHLSGIINFCKFREERLLLLSDLSSTREGLTDQLTQLNEKKENLNNRLSLLREQTAEEAMVITDLESSCTTLQASISAMNQEQQRLKDETADLKNLSVELKENILSRNQLLEELTQQRKLLSLQIVSSPEKFRRQIVEVGQTLQTEQRESKAAEKRVRELTAWHTNVDEAQEDVNAAIEAVSELRAEVDRQKSLRSEAHAGQQAVLTARTERTELEQSAHQMQRNATRTEEKLQQLKKQVQLRGKESQDAVDHLHQQLIETEAFRLQVLGAVLCCYLCAVFATFKMTFFKKYLFIYIVIFAVSVSVSACLPACRWPHGWSASRGRLLAWTRRWRRRRVPSSRRWTTSPRPTSAWRGWSLRTSRACSASCASSIVCVCV
jgi:kinetochore protein Nuf2